jgi:hypothetical protein
MHWQPERSQKGVGGRNGVGGQPIIAYFPRGPAAEAPEMKAPCHLLSITQHVVTSSLRCPEQVPGPGASQWEASMEEQGWPVLSPCPVTANHALSR